LASPVVAFVSFRFGGVDGVSIEAEKWAWALRRLGFRTYRVAGWFGDQQPGDVLLPWLGLGATAEGEPDDVAAVAALAAADLVVAENILSLPLNLDGAAAVEGALRRLGTPTVLHHHDLSWQRPDLPQPPEFPPRLPNAAHVTINHLSRKELASRGIEAVTIHNHFDFDLPLPDRAEARARVGIHRDTLLVLQPTRAIPRKNLAGGLRFAESLQQRLPDRPVQFWLTGPAEEGYDTELARLVSAAGVPVRCQEADPADAYAACDVVSFPSTSEGFGNPLIESMWAHRPVAVAWYPALDELLALGLEVFSIDRPEEVVEALLHGDHHARLERNRRAAHRRLSLDLLPDRLRSLLDRLGVQGRTSRKSGGIMSPTVVRSGRHRSSWDDDLPGERLPR
jgi:mannosylglucosylglycerate synthase